MEAGKKFHQKILLTPTLSKKFYHLIDELYSQYSDQGIENLVLKTFLKVEQALLKPGEAIAPKR